MKNGSKMVIAGGLVCAGALAFVYGRSMGKYKKIDFDVSMRKADFPEVFKKPYMPQIYERFKQLYDHNYREHIASDAAYRIPKILHQVWLGSPFRKNIKNLGTRGSKSTLTGSIACGQKKR